MTTTNSDEQSEEMSSSQSAYETKGLHPEKALNHRQREACRLYALGKPYEKIAERLSYNKMYLYQLFRDPKMQEEVERYRDKVFASDAENRMKDLLPEAFDTMEEILRSDKVDLEKKEGAARWLIEKMTGKPAQQMDAKVEVSLGAVFAKLDQLGDMKDVEAKSPQLPESDGEVINVAHEDAEAKETVELDRFDDWLEKNM